MNKRNFLILILSALIMLFSIPVYAEEGPSLKSSRIQGFSLYEYLNQDLSFYISKPRFYDSDHFLLASCMELSKSNDETEATEYYAQYSDNGQLSSLRRKKEHAYPSYDGQTNIPLSVKDIKNANQLFAYTDSGLIKQIKTDENSTKVTNEENDSGRVLANENYSSTYDYNYELNGMGLPVKVMSTYQKNNGDIQIAEERYDYDASGHIVCLANGAFLRRYLYDDAGRLISVDTEDQGVITGTHRYSYDEQGNLIWEKSENRAGSPGNYEISYVYDNGRIISKYGFPYIYEYNEAGNIIRTTFQNTTWEYDNNGNVIKQSVTGDNSLETTIWEYDIYGNVIKETYQDLYNNQLWRSRETIYSYIAKP